MCPAAARLNDPIAHTSMLGHLAKMGGSLIAGALVGAALTAVAVVAVGAVVATGGLGLGAVLAIGFGASVAMEASGLNGFIDRSINSLVDSFIPPSIEGKIASGSPDVSVNSMPAARAASPDEQDIIACSKHSSGPPHMIAQGSDNVFINDHPAARKDDKTTCDGTIAAGSGNVTIGGGTRTVREIQDERPWWITALGTALGVALTLCGRGRLNISSLKAALPCLLMNAGASMFGSWVGSKIRNFIGNPVNVITGGKVMLDDADFVLPGPMPLEWTRFYSSHDRRDGGLFGLGWSVPYEVELTLERDGTGALAALVYCDAQGRSMRFPAVHPGESHYSSAEGYYLICTEAGQYVVESGDGLYRDFGVPPEGYTGTLELQRLEDRNGNWHALRYADGRLSQINDSCGRTLELAYDQLYPSRVAAIRNIADALGEPAETLVEYRYSAYGELAEVIDRTGQRTRRFAYRKGLMREHSVPGGLQCFYEWEGEGATARVVRHWTSDGEAYVLRYDLAARRTLVTDQLDRQYQWEWNADCQPTMYIDPEGHVWRCAWDANRQPVEAVDPLGAVTRWEYDALGRIKSMTNALGQIEKTQWHERLDLPTAEIDAAGNRWQYAYDARGNLLVVTDPEGHETEQAYDERGLPHTIRDARGGYKHMAWNSRAQLTAYTDCSGKTTHFAYDARGALASVTDALGNATTYRTDALGRVTEIVDPEGGVQKLHYDPLGRLAAITDAAEYTTRYERNARGLPLRRIDALGHAVEFAYDSAQRLVRLTNENGEAYRFTYDGNDNLVEEIGLDGTVKRIEHDARGLPVKVTDAADTAEALTLHLERDALGRLAMKHARGRSTLYRYDQLGQLLQAEIFSDDGQRRTVHDKLLFSYSKRGELLSETGHLGTLRHRYDELGNRCATTLPDGRTINRLHYGSGHLHQINIDGEVISDFERDDLHREVARTQGQLSTRFGYDKLGRKAWQETLASQGAHEPVLRKEWQYDRAGELVRKFDSRRGETRYQYDALGRILTTIGAAQREVFHWDAAANLVDSTQVGGYVKYNRVTMFEDKRYDYDVHGRLETKRIGHHTVQKFYYDGEHRLQEVETIRNGVRQVVWFEYDALGRRIRKHDAFGITSFLWDGLQMMQEQRGGSVATYLYEPDSYVPLARVDGSVHNTPSAGAGDGLSSQTGERDAVVLHFHSDPNGMPDELWRNSGEVAWRAEYKSWGSTVTESWTARPLADGELSPLPQNIRFQGQYLDRDIGLHYNTFRFYDPDVGRFVSSDPIGLNGGENLYRYSPNPILWVDPLGWASFNPGVYDVLFEARLPSAEMYRMDDPAHFSEGNRQLHYAIKNNPQLAQSLEARYPGISRWVAPTRIDTFRGVAFKGTTWHHHSVVGGLLQLVDMKDHRSRHLDYHPKGVGGRNVWGGGTRCR